MPQKSEATGGSCGQKVTHVAEKRKKKTTGPYCGPARLHYPLLLEIIRILELLDD